MLVFLWGQPDILPEQILDRQEMGLRLLLPGRSQGPSARAGRLRAGTGRLVGPAQRGPAGIRFDLRNLSEDD